MTVSRDNRDFEDRLDEAGLAALRFVARNVWPIADRVFKLVAWMLALAVLRTLQIRSDHDGFKWAVFVLSLLWILAACGSVFEACTTIHEKVTGRVARGGSLVIPLIVGFILSMTLVIGGIRLAGLVVEIFTVIVKASGS